MKRRFDRIGIFRRMAFYLAMALGSLPFFCVAQAQEQDGERQAIRVAYPVQWGLTQYDEKGGFSGYSYEFLQEISQYTGWEYEFIVINTGDINQDLTTACELVARGDADLIGGMVYSDQLAQRYEYPVNSYGSSYTVLSALEENAEINEVSYRHYPNLRVALYRGSVMRRQELETFADTQSLSLEYVECGPMEESANAVREGKADVFLTKDISMPVDMRAVARFAPSPYYFACTKGRTDLAGQLDAAILNIQESNPHFAASLYAKYFNAERDEIHLSRDEADYVKAHPTLRVALWPFQSPLQRYDSVKGEALGILPDYLRLVGEKIGLTFEFVYMEDHRALRDAIEEKQVDLVAGFYHDYDLAGSYGVSLSQPVISAQVVLAVNKSVKADGLSERIIALPQGYDFLNVYNSPIRLYPSVEECLEAVNSVGEADYFFGDVYTVQAITNQRYYSNLNLIPQAAILQEFCVGVVRSASPELLSILNKAQRGVSQGELQAIIYQNSGLQSGPVTLEVFLASNWQAVMVGVLAVCGVIILLLLQYLRRRSRVNREISLANQRYKQLSALSNEILFEYDIPRDRFTMSDKGGQFFGVSSTLEGFSRRVKDRMDLGTLSLSDLLERLEQGGGTPIDIQVRLGEDDFRWLRVVANIIRDEGGNAVYALGKAMDISSEREAQEMWKEQAQRDGLTQVLNAGACRQAVREALADPEFQGGALFILDVDDFKSINDQHGHYVGDRVLMELGEVLQSQVRHEDIVGRLGGDEFLVFLRGVQDREMVRERCIRIRERMRDLISKWPISFSIGVAMVGEERDFDALYRRADQAMYTVKNKGRDGFEIV